MSAELVIDVLGVPVPQGSMIAVPRGDGRAQVIPDNDKILKPWRKAVATAARARRELTEWATLDGPIDVELTFWLERPAAAAHREYPHVRPDLDKLGRAILDALTYAEVYVDDARVVNLQTRKRYGQRLAGVRIKVRQSEYGLTAAGAARLDRLDELGAVLHHKYALTKAEGEGWTAGEVQDDVAWALVPEADRIAWRAAAAALLDELDGGHL